jgi:hypothetical protein
MIGPVALLLFQVPPPQAGLQQWFEEKIRPLLASRCIGCHGDARVSGLRLDSRSGALAGGRRGPALIPGDPAQSLMIRAIERTEALKMPPEGPLGESEVRSLKEWIRLGAPWPEARLVAASGKVTAADRDWWAFRPLRPVTHPPVPGRHPIDRFVRARQIEAKVHPVKPADRRTLLRRLSFDLIGLPPSPAEVDDFVRSGDIAGAWNGSSGPGTSASVGAATGSTWPGMAKMTCWA